MAASLLRNVLDTNVYVSAALHGRVADSVLELASIRLVSLVTSEIILGELEDKLRNKLRWSIEQSDLFLDVIRDIAEIVDPQIVLNVVPDDEDDNRIVECAVAGGADLIVTFDKDLLQLKSYEMIGIITPRQLSFHGTRAKEK